MLIKNKHINLSLLIQKEVLHGMRMRENRGYLTVSHELMILLVCNYVSVFLRAEQCHQNINMERFWICLTLYFSVSFHFFLQYACIIFKSEY